MPHRVWWSIGSPHLRPGESEPNPLQAFYRRFSEPIRALPPEPAGADAWRATTYGHGVLQTNPLGSALDQVNQVRILEGQLTAELTAREPLRRFVLASHLRLLPPISPGVGLLRSAPD